MGVSLQQVQRQTQRLIMTPQMQQSIQLLQMTSMELEQLLHNEMQENPFLELADDEENLQSRSEGEGAEAAAEEAPPESGLSEQAVAEPAEVDPPEPAFEASIPPRETETVADGGAGGVDALPEEAGTGEFDSFAQTDVDWDSEYSDSDASAYSGTREETEERDFTQYRSAGEGLYESLMRQVRLSTLEGRDMEIGEFIVGNLNEDGLLDCRLENLATLAGYPPELVAPKQPEDAAPRLIALIQRVAGRVDRTRYEGMKARELALHAVAAILHRPVDALVGLKREVWLLALIAKRLRRQVRELRTIPRPELLLEVLAHRFRTTPQRVFDVLEVVQDFEPTGVAARDLAECLRLQCEERGFRSRLLYTILERHLTEIQEKRFREIAQAEGCTEADVVEVFETISRLEPRPGRSKTRDTPRYITPDVYVKKMDDKYLYFLNEGDAGRLHVASNYRRLMTRPAPTEANGGSPRPPGEREYAAEKYKSAVWLIKNIEKRKSTILRVTEAIMNYQKEFLDKGIEHLRPLTLRDIAEVVGMHESTIARVTTQKYVETPRGLFELKFFFSSGLDTDSGEEASSRAIKEMITQLIGGENLRHPLSDQKIANTLNDRGIQIARRTVAKYREQIKILPAKLRKSAK